MGGGLRARGVVVGAIEDVEKLSQESCGIAAVFEGNAAQRVGEAVWGKNAGVFGKKAKQQAGKENIERVECFGG